MAHFKRHKSKRPIRCSYCTPFRWLGNYKGRFKPREVMIRREKIGAEPNG